MHLFIVNSNNAKGELHVQYLTKILNFFLPLRKIIRDLRTLEEKLAFECNKMRRFYATV